MCFTLGAVIRPVTMGIGKLFRILLDRANERVQDLQGKSSFSFLGACTAHSCCAKMPLYQDLLVW